MFWCKSAKVTTVSMNSNPVQPPPTTLLLQPQLQPSDTLAKDCKEFYEKRLQLTHSVEHKWSSEASLPSLSPFSKLPHQIAQLRSELLSLAHLDNELFKNLLALNDKLEELKLHRDHTSGSTTTSNEGDEEAVTKTETTTEEEYDDDDIDEEVDDDNADDDAFSAVYSSLPPTQILERAAAAAAAAEAAARVNPEDTSADENQSPSSENNGSSGLDVMGGLKFMLRSRSFLLRPPFHKKNSASSAATAPPPTVPVQSRTTPRRSRITSSDSPFR